MIFRVIVFAAMAAVFGGSCDRTPRPGLTTTMPTPLRHAADEGSAVVCLMEAGTSLFDMGEVSPYLSGILWGDTLLWEPWLRVRTLRGETGWVFGGAVQPDTAPDAFQRWRCDKRLQAIFGRALALRLRRWAEERPQTDTTLAQHFRIGLGLRDSLLFGLRYGLRRPSPDARPGLRWLDPYLSYLRRYRGGIAVDFTRFAQAAAQTEGEQDDLFARLALTIYPIDSMESPLPVWVFPLSWTESASNLGAGHHRATLHSLAQMRVRASLFQAEIDHFRNLILEDILDGERAYWQPLERILAEIDSILADTSLGLTEQERSALRLRCSMLLRGQARTNLRSGR